MRDPLPNHSLVAVLGLGASGKAACELLSALGKSVIASDSRDELDYEPPVGVEVRLGTNEIGDATAAILSPSLNPEWPENLVNPALAGLWAARTAARVEVWSEIELALQAVDRPAITIGGTDGKSTTASLVRSLAIAAGFPPVFGGNSWTALSQRVVEADERAALSRRAPLCVAEVSAFQLWAGHRVRPRISVLTNIELDHLDHYADASGYVTAKLHIHQNMGPGDTAVLYAADWRLGGQREALQARGVRVCGYSLDRPTDGWDAAAWVEDHQLCVDDERGSLRVPTNSLSIPGAHNHKNALAALLALRSTIDVQAPEASKGLGDFPGLPHRLELVRTLADVRWFNDSKATNVHAAVTGLRALDGRIVAIVGGVDKSLDLAPLIDVLKAKARTTIVIGDLRDRLCREGGAAGLKLTPVESIAAAVGRARYDARPGDAVVLAPGCSSFDMFKSFEHRGDVFRDLVLSLEE